MLHEKTPRRTDETVLTSLFDFPQGHRDLEEDIYPGLRHIGAKVWMVRKDMSVIIVQIRAVRHHSGRG
jgi:hypothetical protein